jgi:serine/threonine protein kinase
VFARKIVRPFGSLSREDIETEMRAINQLNKDGGHPNIINVFAHDWVGYPYRFFFIDMELCDTSLHYYIHGERFDLAVADNTFIRRDAPILNQMLNVWIIMLHISEGVEYIRLNKQVHRDLKPQNSMSLPSQLISPLLRRHKQLENRGFRLYCVGYFHRSTNDSPS